MKRIVVVPDSFKGSVSGERICEIVKKSIAEMLPECEVIGIPAADGGEGTADAFLSALNGEKICLQVQGPYGQPMQVYYGGFEDFAVIEMASCAGLPLVKDQKDPCRTTTFGVGQQICHALESGYRKIIVGIGGSATNDGGCGMAAALGVRFYDAAGEKFIPVGGTLSKIARIDISGIHPLLKESTVLAMCDISNPLYGKNGAAYIFGPQKGADEKMVELLDDGLRNFSDVVRSDLGKDVSELPGSGAAGGMGAGLSAFLNAELRAGIGIVLEYTGFYEKASGADLVITGEGKLDQQTFSGKAVCGVSAACRELGVPCAAIVGSIDPETDYSELGLAAVWDTVLAPMDLEEAMRHTERAIAMTVKNMLGFYKAVR